ncbi:MAG: response regulator [Candidatus Latescibacteria bacterium]|nr:response regulator [bacterium]MBD3424463.1 response regulator [Candidatus Latescibacterota bacterium]
MHSQKYNKRRVLVVDDKADFRRRMVNSLSGEYEVTTAVGWRDGRKKYSERLFDVLLLDYKLDDGYDGLDVIKELRSDRNDNLIIIFISAHLEEDIIEEARVAGADDIISKHTSNRELERKIGDAIRNNLARRIQKLEVIRRKDYVIEPVFESSSMKKIRDRARRFIDLDENILITGPPGAGKGIMAFWIHCRSIRSQGPYYVESLTGLTSDLFSREFKGHVKGAYTGATSDMEGLLDLSHMGTLVLDEIGDLEPKIQKQLLDIVEHKPFRRVGGNREFHKNVRFIALTNKDLREEVKRGSFREDLYHRLKTFHIHIPPLAERKEDIPVLAEEILARECGRRGMNIEAVDPELIDLMLQYEWPGNVRELEEWIKNGITYASSGVLKKEDIPQAVTRAEGTGERLPADIFDMEYQEFKSNAVKSYLEKLLERTGGDMQEAAERAGVLRPALYRLCSRHNVTPADFRDKNKS